MKEIVNRERLEANCQPRNLTIGDVVMLTWFDTVSEDRVESITALPEPRATLCVGIVVKKGPRYLTIASELAGGDTDGTFIEMLPYKMIERCLVLGRIDDPF